MRVGASESGANENGKWNGVSKWISLFLVIIGQTVAAVWWASSISGSVGVLKDQMTFLYAKVDSIAILNTEVQRSSDRNAEQDRRLLEIEGRLREIERIKR